MVVLVDGMVVIRMAFDGKVVSVVPVVSLCSNECIATVCRKRWHERQKGLAGEVYDFACLSEVAVRCWME